MDDLTTLVTWCQAHRVEIIEAAAALWVVASIYVRLTPSKRDDEALTRFRVEVLERLSFLQPADGRGVFSAPGAPARREAKLLESRR